MENLLGNAYNISVHPTSGPKIIDDFDSWPVITWSDSIEFLDGHRLEFSDNYSRGLTRQVKREFSFHFMDPNRNCIFRFTTHGQELPDGAPCQLRIGPLEELATEGDPRLRGYSLTNVNFLVVFRLIHRYLEGHGLPWQ